MVKALANSIVTVLFLAACGSIYLVPSSVIGQVPELYAEVGHNKWINSVAFSPDGRLVASGSADHTVKIWDTVSGRQLRTLFHSKYVFSVAFSPDGKVLASGSLDKTVKLWDVATGKELATLSGLDSKPDEAGGIYAIAISNDGKLLASAASVPDTKSTSAGWDNTIQLWDIATRKIIRTIRPGPVPAWTPKSLGFSPDGKLLACQVDKSIVLWTVATGREIHRFSTEGTVDSVSFSPDGLSAVTLESHKPKPIDPKYPNRIVNTISIVDLTTYRVVRTQEEKELQNVDSVYFSADGKSLIIGRSSKIEISDVTSGVVKTAIATGTAKDPATLSAISPHDQLFATTHSDATIKLWNVANGTLQRTLAGQSQGFTNITSVVFSPDGRFLANTNGQQELFLWNLASGAKEGTFDDRPYSMAFSPDGKILATGNGDFSGGTVVLRDLSSGTKKFELEPDPLPPGPKLAKNEIDGRLHHAVSSVAFSPDGKTLASGEGFGEIPDVEGDPYFRVKLWNVETGKLRKVLLKSPKPVFALVFSRDGKMIATSTGKEVALWNAETGAKLRVLENTIESDFLQLAFSPESDLLAGGGDLGEIVLWKAETGEKVSESSGDEIGTAEITSLSFAGDNLLASAGGNNITFWHVAADSEKIEKTATLQGHTDIVEAIAFSADGKLMASKARANDPVLRLWNVDVEKETAELVPVNLIPINKGDWLATTPEGFFDGTPNAWKQLIWRFNGNTFDYGSVDLYFNDFFYPNLLKDVLAGRSPAPKRGSELEQIDRRQPKVEIARINGLTKAVIDQEPERRGSTFYRTTIVEIDVTDNNEKRKNADQPETGGAQDLRLFRNGLLVDVWHGDLFGRTANTGCKPVTATKPDEPRKVRCSAVVSVQPGVNNFTAYAFNSSNVKSTDVPFSIEGRESVKRTGVLYILEIGVNKYANPAYNLNFAVPDVNEIGAAIKSNQEKQAADPKDARFVRTEIVSLTDEKATKQNILLSLGLFFSTEVNKIPADASPDLRQQLEKIKRAEPEDTILIYYAGHGTSVGDRFYLLPHDFAGGDSSALASSGISDLELSAALENIDAGKMMMVIDACQSGQALGGTTEGRAPMNSKGLAQLAYDKGMLILTAAQSQQAALEAVTIDGKEIRHGLLTYALLQALTAPEADRNGNKELSDREWFDYATKQVPLLQLAAMKQRHIDVEKTKRGTEIVFVNGDKNADPNKRGVQTPRVFYRREADTEPLVIARLR